MSMNLSQNSKYVSIFVNDYLHQCIQMYFTEKKNKSNYAKLLVKITLINVIEMQVKGRSIT